MKDFVLRTVVYRCLWEELSPEDRSLVEAAKQAASTAYAPYSGFSVGAAVLLEGGEVVAGSNQENASYPCGLCAERVALFHATSSCPGRPVKALAIAARNSDGFTRVPVTPCGACRQVLVELKSRFRTPVRLLLYGTSEVYLLEDACDLLPLSFQDESMY